MKKLKQPDIKAYRENMLREQGGKCAFCGYGCTKPCLDHAHMEPYKDRIRGVICNWCNIAIGKLENARVRTGTDWNSFCRSFPHVYSYVKNPGLHKADWHPHKRKSELIEFKKLKAPEQTKRLSDMEHELGIPLAFVPKNVKQRVALFGKLNAKT